MFAIVDDENFRELNKYKWCYRTTSKDIKNGYAGRRLPKTINGGIILMHRQIMKPKKGFYVDHINRNRLDNRKCNLRICTNQENSINSKISKKNTSGYKGVYWDKRRNKWIANITAFGKNIYLGSFKDKKDAAKRYRDYATKRWDKFVGELSKLV